MSLTCDGLRRSQSSVWPILYDRSTAFEMSGKKDFMTGFCVLNIH